MNNGWNGSELSALVQKARKITYGIVQPGDYTAGGVPLVRGQDYSKGWVPTENLFHVSHDIDRPYKRSKLNGGDLVMTIVGAGTGTVAVVPNYLNGANITQTTARIAIDSEKADSEFIRHQLQSVVGQREVYRYIKGGAQPGLNLKDVEKFYIPLPPLPEQRKIAEILGACDATIEAQERLIAQKQERKKGLMQQLLTGKVRFPEFVGSGEWKEVSLGSLLKEVKRSVNWDDNELYQLLSLRRRSGGPFARESLYGNQIKTKNLKTVHAGDFLIAKMQVTHGALGLVTPEFHEYKVSDSYICMVPRKPSEFDIRFLNYLSQDRHIWHLAYVSSYGVAIEKMTFVLKDFLKKEIAVPPTKEECAAIADFIDTLNDEISSQIKKLEQLKEQKKGLMQQLLTGKVRVCV